MRPAERSGKGDVQRLRVGEREHRRYTIHADEFLVVQGGLGLAQCLESLLGIRGTQADCDWNLAVWGQEHAANGRSGWHNLDHPGAGPHLHIGAELKPKDLSEEAPRGVLVRYGNRYRCQALLRCSPCKLITAA